MQGCVFVAGREGVGHRILRVCLRAMFVISDACCSEQVGADRRQGSCRGAEASDWAEDAESQQYVLNGVDEMRGGGWAGFVVEEGMRAMIF